MLQSAEALRTDYRALIGVIARVRAQRAMLCYVVDAQVQSSVCAIIARKITFTYQSKNGHRQRAARTCCYGACAYESCRWRYAVIYHTRVMLIRCRYARCY